MVWSNGTNGSVIPVQSRVEMLRSQKEFYERRCHELASSRGQGVQAQDGVESAINNANGYNTMVSGSFVVTPCAAVRIYRLPPAYGQPHASLSRAVPRNLCRIHETLKLSQEAADLRQKLEEAEKELAQLRGETEATEKQLREELQEAKSAALAARSSAASMKVGIGSVYHVDGPVQGYTANLLS